MKRILSLLLVVAAMAVGTAEVDAQEARERPPRTDRQAERAGPGFLLRLRAELQLTDRQIAQLDSIADRLEAQNRPLRQRLSEAGVPVHRHGEARRRMSPEEREALRARLEAHRPTLLEMKRNAERAMGEARAVLTPAQRERLQAIVRERVERRDHRRSEVRHGPAAHPVLELEP